MIIGIDFYGTCVTHEFPNVGKDIEAVPVLKKIINSCHKLILWTMRSHRPEGSSKDVLQDAIDWFEYNNIPLYGINENPDQHTWTNSPKAHCNLYIDDTAFGCSLIMDKNVSNRPFVNWGMIDYQLSKEGIIE